MSDSKNTFKGLFFFFCRLILIAVVVSLVYLAYDLYNAKKTEVIVNRSVEVVEQLHDLLK